MGRMTGRAKIIRAQALLVEALIEGAAPVKEEGKSDGGAWSFYRDPKTGRIASPGSSPGGETDGETDGEPAEEAREISQEQVDRAIAADGERTKSILKDAMGSSLKGFTDTLMHGVDIVVGTFTGSDLTTGDIGKVIRSGLEDVWDAVQLVGSQDASGVIAGAAVGSIGLVLTASMPLPKSSSRAHTRALSAATFWDEHLLQAAVKQGVKLLGPLAPATPFGWTRLAFGVTFAAGFAVATAKALREKSELAELIGEDPREIARTQKNLRERAEETLRSRREEMSAKMVESLKAEMLESRTIADEIRRTMLPTLDLGVVGTKNREVARTRALALVARLTPQLKEKALKKHYGLDLPEIQNQAVQGLLDDLEAQVAEMPDTAHAAEMYRLDPMERFGR